MAPIREVCSPVNSMKPAKSGIEARSPASRKIAHAAVYGPPTREAAVRPTSRPVPGQGVDATLTIKNTGDRGK
jgi:hypothetical protein